MSRFIIGLTGGIASGKSLLARYFQAHGIVVCDADEVARAVVAPGPVLTQIMDHFGPAVLLADGTLDRRALRQIVFADRQQRRVLEAITHPAIRRALHAACSTASSLYSIAAIPLLAEAGGRNSYPWLDRILLIDTPRELQLQRLMQRDAIDAGLAEQMIAAQAGREQRLALADDVLVNAGLASDLEQGVRELDARYRQLATEKSAQSTP